MSGTFGYEATVANNRASNLCKTVEGGLRILNMNGLGLDGLAIPDCLLGKQSTLEEARLGAPPRCVNPASHHSLHSRDWHTSRLAFRQAQADMTRTQGRVLAAAARPLKIVWCLLGSCCCCTLMHILSPCTLCNIA